MCGQEAVVGGQSANAAKRLKVVLKDGGDAYERQGEKACKDSKNDKKKRRFRAEIFKNRATDFDMKHRSVTGTVASSKATSWHNPRSA